MPVDNTLTGLPSSLAIKSHSIVMHLPASNDFVLYKMNQTTNSVMFGRVVVSSQSPDQPAGVRLTGGQVSGLSDPRPARLFRSAAAFVNGSIYEFGGLTDDSSANGNIYKLDCSMSDPHSFVLSKNCN